MKILVLNCGSSSIKYKLYDMTDQSVLAAGGVERIGLDEAFIKVTLPNGEKKKIMHDMPDHKEGVNFVFQCLLDKEIGAIKSLDEIDAVGHRIVQGGDLFEKSVIVDKSVEDGIESLCDLAPVHNAGHLKGLRAVDHLMPNTPQVCVFDNAFHSTMPDYAYLYAVPYELYEKYHVRRYGFHGTSHKYVGPKAAQLAGYDYEHCKIVSCHLGNGASICAIKDGKSIDNSMGFTPVEGLMMGTRCGDIDAGALIYIMDSEKLDTKGLNTLINKKSGLLGISGKSVDMRDIRAGRDAGDERATYAFNMFAYRVKKYIGAYAAAMGGVDVILFTGGIGENAWFQREAICNGLEFLGAKLDPEANQKYAGEDGIISTPDSTVKLVSVTTNEELVMAMDTYNLVK